MPPPFDRWTDWKIHQPAFPAAIGRAAAGQGSGRSQGGCGHSDNVRAACRMENHFVRPGRDSTACHQVDG
eukprot:365707-Chlamydomonas_euryale.AAC.34